MYEIQRPILKKIAGLQPPVLETDYETTVIWQCGTDRHIDETD